MNTKDVSQLGVLLDWDGVVVDSARQHRASWEEMARENNRILPPDYFLRAFGKTGDAIVAEVFGWTTDYAEALCLAERKEEIYRAIMAESGVEAMPGVAQLLSKLGANGVPVAIATSNPRANVTCMLDKLGLATRWAGIVAAEDVSRGKPDPEVFLRAAGLVAREPRHCVVVEDALVGFEAAHRAGMKTIGVATTLPLSVVRKHADLGVANLGEVTMGEILELISTANPG